jgi:hypothetical protein
LSYLVLRDQDSGQDVTAWIVLAVPDGPQVLGVRAGDVHDGVAHQPTLCVSTPLLSPTGAILPTCPFLLLKFIGPVNISVIGLAVEVGPKGII